MSTENLCRSCGTVIPPTGKRGRPRSYCVVCKPPGKPSPTNPRPPYQAHSATSKAAAEAAEDNAPIARKRVYGAVAETGSFGMTDEEIADTLSMNPSTARPRRVELVRGGILVDSGDQRKTKGGKLATVWVVAPGLTADAEAHNALRGAAA